MPVWFTEHDHRALRAVMDALIPPDGVSPGAGEAGGADYVDRLLGAFTFDPPRIWAGGPFSGRHGGEAGFDDWLEVGPMEELAWRIRIEGTRGLPEREFNGPHTGWQTVYRDALAALTADGLDGPALEALSHDDRLARVRERCGGPAVDVMFTHACESLYGDPVYGGNAGGAAWAAIGFAGDVQPRGWTDLEVSGRD